MKLKKEIDFAGIYTRKNLCELFGEIPVESGGTNKKKQLERFSKYYVIEKIDNFKYIIEQKENCSIDISDYVKSNILNTSQTNIILTRKSLLKQNFPPLGNKLFKDIVYKYKDYPNTNITYKKVQDCYDFLNDKLFGYIERSLECLKKEGYVKYSRAYYLKVNDEVEKIDGYWIDEIRKQVSLELNCDLGKIEYFKRNNKCLNTVLMFDTKVRERIKKDYSLKCEIDDIEYYLAFEVEKLKEYVYVSETTDYISVCKNIIQSSVLSSDKSLNGIINLEREFIIKELLLV